MYYFLLILASLFFGGQFMAVKGYEKTNGQSIRASAKFSALYGLFAFVIFFCANGCKLSYSNFSLLLAALLAVVGIACNMVGLKTLSMGDIAVYSLFMMLGGMIVPFLYGVIFLKETIGAWNIVGLVFLIAALALPLFEKKEKKEKGKALFYVLCIGLFFLNGMSSTLSKIHQIDARAVPSLDFTATLFGVQAVLGLVVWLATFIPLKPRNAVPEPADEEPAEPAPEKYSRKKKLLFTLLCAFAFAAVNGTATFLQLVSAKHVSATAQFPIITGGTLVFSAILGWLSYKEKLSKLKIAQVAVAFGASILFIL